MIYSEIEGSLKPILRKASPEDLRKKVDLDIKALEALAICRDQARSLNLSMKMLEAHWSLDGGRVTFYFSAEDRVDFRPLLHSLGELFHKRVELRQVGARAEAKFAGGLGRCGRILCCVCWMTTFANVTVRMAKEQALPISAENLSGACGRLRCCLRYEYDQYMAMNKALPRRGERVNTPFGMAKVIVGHPLKDTISVLTESEAIVEVPMSDVTREAVGSR